MFDLVIKNGEIIDGSGNQPFKSDIGIRNGRINFLTFTLLILLRGGRVFEKKKTGGVGKNHPQ